MFCILAEFKSYHICESHPTWYTYLTPNKPYLCRGGSRGRVQGVRTPPEMTCGFLINTVQSASQLYKICFIIWYVFSAVHIMSLPSRKPSSSYSLLKLVYVTSQLHLSSAPPPTKNPGSASVMDVVCIFWCPLQAFYTINVWAGCETDFVQVLYWLQDWMWRAQKIWSKKVLTSGGKSFNQRR